MPHHAPPLRPGNSSATSTSSASTSHSNPLISIIIPAYNAAQYLSATLDSLTDQTYPHYEIILIDDGSTDATRQICQQHAQKNPRITYHHQLNAGVSASRNTGLQLATGQYICFVDADDLVSPHYLSDFISAANHPHQPDLVCCQIQRFKDSLPRPRTTSVLPSTLTASTKYHLLFNQYGGYIYNKLFKTSLIATHQLTLPTDIKMCEDLIFTLRYLQHASTVTCLPFNNYYYRIISSSASKQLSNPGWFTIFQALDILLTTPELSQPPFQHQAAYLYLAHLYEAQYRLPHITDSASRQALSTQLQAAQQSHTHLHSYLTPSEKTKIFLHHHFTNLVCHHKIKKELSA